MKTAAILSVAAIALLDLAIAQPHGHRHRHAERDVEEVVYVDQYGNALTTSLLNGVASATASGAQATSVVPTSVASGTSSAPSSTASSSSGGGFGVAYGPYTSSGSGCKSQSEINSDIAQLASYGKVRIYDPTCLSQVISAAKANGLKVFAGTQTMPDPSSDVQSIISQAKDDWDIIDTINIGNEAVQGGKASASQVVAALQSARSALTAAGYTGDIVTVDTVGAIQSNPSLCENSDYVAANAHGFFNSDVTSSSDGTFVAGQATLVGTICPGKRVCITESGWPHSGNSNGAAVASSADQAAAIAALKASFASQPENLILFEAWDEAWKAQYNNAGTYDAEQYWGFMN